MCLALAGDFSPPWELTRVPRCSFPLSFEKRFSVRHLLPPQQPGTSLVLSQSAGQRADPVGAGGCSTAAWWMLGSTLRSPPAPRRLLIKGS